MSDFFECTYEVDDGYAGGARPQDLCLSEDDIDDGMSEEGLRNAFYSAMQDDFEEKINPWADSEVVEEFVAWAKTKIAEAKDE